MHTKRLKLVNITPIGYIYPKYPVNHCALCKGLLIEDCVNCAADAKNVKNSKVCEVIDIDNIFYHDHCYKSMDKNDKK